MNNKSKLSKQEKRELMWLAFERVDSLIPFESPCDFSLEQIKVFHTVWEEMQNTYTYLENDIKQDIAKEINGEETEYFIAPTLFLFLIEKLQQENLRIMLMLMYDVIAIKTKQVAPKKRIEGLDSSLTAEKKKRYSQIISIQ